MKSTTEVKFDSIVRDVFHATLKPYGFRKKGNSFYLDNGIGKLINLQKSLHNSKDHILFTINVSIFLPDYWELYYNYYGTIVPVFPTDADCILRKRIGSLTNSTDTWYDIDKDTDIEKSRSIQTYNLESVILPYLDGINSNGELLGEISNGHAVSLSPIAKLFMLGRMKLYNEFHLEYRQILSSTIHPRMETTLKELASFFGIEKSTA
jgi:hypothetical protein